jgi:MFS family permease
MVKSGLIVGVVMLLLALGTALITPICSICIAVLAGLAAGYLANVFEKPQLPERIIGRGAGAGAIAGLVAIIGQIIGAVINATFVDSAALNEILESYGGTMTLTDETMWAAQLGMAFCIGLFNVAIMAGLGAAGAMIWRQRQGNFQAPNPPGYQP